MKTERKAVFGIAAWGVVLLFLVGSFSSMAYLDSHMLRVTDSTATNQSNTNTQKINGLDLSKDYRIVGIPGLTKEREQFLMEETKKVLREHPAAFKSVDELRAYNPDAIEPTPMELSRGTRAGDVNLTYCEYGVVNQGWAGNMDDPNYPGTQSMIGCFFNGKASTITAHITNGDSTPAVVNARLVIKDFYGEEAVNTTKSVTVAPGGEGTVTYDWTPQWVSSQAILLAQQQGTSWAIAGVVVLRGFEINITIDTTNGTTPDNNVWDDVVLVGELVDDAEHGESIMSGDKSSTTWHITDSPANTIKKGNHSGTHAWYCGTEGITDHYGANIDARLISPSFDLSTYDTTNWYVMNWNIMAGATQEGDGINIEWSTDDGATWGQGLFHDPGIGGANAPPSLATEWGSLTPISSAGNGYGYVFYGFPCFEHSDDMSHVRFSYHFTSNDAGGEPGYYLDDFILMGVQITHDVGVSNMSVSNHIMRVGQQMSITVEGQNYGMKAENNVFYNMSIYEGFVNYTQKKDATPVDTPQSQTQSTLAVASKASKTFHWTPTKAGVYTVWFQVTSAEDKAAYNDDAGAVIHVNPTDPGSILVVDDESLGAYGEHNITAALDANSYTYDVYTMSYFDNGPSASDMEAYDLVIWRVGQSSSTLTTADQSSIDTYLSHGGSLWLIGEDILYDLVKDKNGAVSGWSNTGLHVATVQHDVGLPNPLVGVSGDPITNGMSLTTTGSGWGDDITPASGAVGIFNSAQTNFSAIRYRDDSTSGKLVFFAFDFNDLVDTTDQANVVKAVYSWIVPSYTATATGPTNTAPSNVSAINITYTYDSGTPSVYLYYTTDGGASWHLIGNDTSIDGSCGWTIPADGTYGWMAVADGESAPTGGTAPEAFSYTYDGTSPEITITSPSDGAISNTSAVTVSWNGSDSGSGIDHYEIRNDSGAWENVGLNISYNFTGLSDGFHTGEVKAIDIANNCNSTSITFTVDTTPPEITITSPADGAILNTSAVTASWAGSDASGIDHYELRIDSGSWSDIGMNTSYNFTGLSDGFHTVDVKAVDNADNENENIPSVTFTVDTITPEITITSLNGALLNTSVTISWAGSDASGIDHYELRIDSGPWSDIGMNTSYNFIDLPDGFHTVDVKAVDNAGNKNTVSVTFTVNTRVIDTTAPTVISHSPTGSGVPVDSVIRVTFSEPIDQSTGSIELNGVTGTITWSNNTAIFTPSHNLSYSTNYTVNVIGSDLAGNIMEMYIWSFTTTGATNTGETGTITGTVIDRDGNPIEESTVTLDSGETTTTDANGHFEIQASAGDHTLTISKDGYKTETQNVSVTAGQENKISPVGLPLVGHKETKETESQTALLWIILLIVVIVILLTVFFVIRRKKEEETSVVVEGSLDDAEEGGEEEDDAEAEVEIDDEEIEIKMDSGFSEDLENIVPVAPTSSTYSKNISTTHKAASKKKKTGKRKKWKNKPDSRWGLDMDSFDLDDLDSELALMEEKDLSEIRKGSR